MLDKRVDGRNRKAHAKADSGMRAGEKAGRLVIGFIRGSMLKPKLPIHCPCYVL